MFSIPTKTSSRESVGDRAAGRWMPSLADDDVPRDSHSVLAGESGGGDAELDYRMAVRLRLGCV